MVSWIFVGGAVLFLLVLVAIVAYNMLRGTLWENFRQTYGLTYVLLPLVAGLMVFGSWKAGSHGAFKVMIDDSALSFEWKSGKVDVLRWNSPDFDLSLIDWNSTGIGRYSPLLWEARRWNRPKTDLTRDSFTAILEAAREHGLTVERKSRSGLAGGGTVIRIRFPSNSSSTVS